MIAAGQIQGQLATGEPKLLFLSSPIIAADHSPSFIVTPIRPSRARGRRRLTLLRPQQLEEGGQMRHRSQPLPDLHSNSSFTDATAATHLQPSLPAAVGSDQRSQADELSSSLLFPNPSAPLEVNRCPHHRLCSISSPMSGIGEDAGESSLCSSPATLRPPLIGKIGSLLLPLAATSSRLISQCIIGQFCLDLAMSCSCSDGCSSGHCWG